MFSEAVALDRPCQFTEQCSFSQHTLCAQGKCSCIDGYLSYATNRCLPGLSNNEFHNLSAEVFYNKVTSARSQPFKDIIISSNEWKQQLNKKNEQIFIQETVEYEDKCKPLRLTNYMCTLYITSRMNKRRYEVSDSPSLHKDR